MTKNNLMSLKELVFTLLVFSAYFRIIKLNTLFSSIIKYGIDIKTAIDKIQRCIAFCQINNALNI